MIPTQTRSGLGSKIRAMFSRGEQGVLFNPNDTSTLFEDAAGTKPAVLEGLVGLMLDQSKGLVLGPELVTNGDFSNGTTGWTAGGSASLSAVNGKLRILQTSTGAAWAYQVLSTVVGRRYWVSLSFESVSGSTLAVFVGTTIGGVETYVATPGNVTSYTFSFVATATSHYINVQPWTISLNREAYFDNISVRELPGNHATSSSTARPTLTRRVNLLSNTEALTAAAWTKTAGVVVTDNAALAPNGTMTASTIALGAFGREIAQSFSATTATTTPTFYVKGTAGQVLNFGAAGVDRSITLTGGWDIATSTLPSGVTKFYIGNYSGGANALNISIWHPDLRPTNIGVNLPAYQRVGDTSVNAADYDTTGFPAWLRCSGGQSMVTPSINFTGTDKMTVWAGVRKTNTTDAYGAVMELSSSATNNGTFSLWAPNGAAATYGFLSKGTVPQVPTPSGYLSPITRVLSGIGDIFGDIAILRVNGTQAAISTADQGTGNYGNYPLYLFARNQSSLFFNGLAGPIIVRGTQSSPAEIANAENWINAQQKAYQPLKIVFTALDSTGVSYPILEASVDSSGLAYTIPATVLDSAGTSYNLI